MTRSRDDFVRAVLGASQMVELVLRDLLATAWFHTGDADLLVDNRIERRCLAPQPELWLSPKADVATHRGGGLGKQILESIQRNGWNVRTLPLLPSWNCLVVDREHVFCPIRDHGKNRWGLLDPASQDHALVIREISRLWDDSSNLELLYEDLLWSSTIDGSRSIVLASQRQWDGIISYLGQHPEALLEMPPRKFEELVAELLNRQGMDVEITEPSKDGGRDLLARCITTAGEHLYLVECKRYSKDHPVGVALVRMLYGVIEAERATGGLLVTTSRFTGPAKQFQTAVSRRLWLKDYSALCQWLRA